MNDDEPVPLTTGDAARLAGVKPQTISMWRARGHLAPAGYDDRGRPVYRQQDVARAEQATRAGARRNVGLRTVATQDIADHEATLVRLDCGHLKILSTRHAPQAGRRVACFECSGQSSIAYQLEAAPSRAA
ncbi:MerR family transcriptional regulator [Streptomyces rochei]|uniref:MerR family transcriptional regulator n=1 Tax=Streptomyces TaxID=1883 RepID=UPI0021AE89D0|nr:MerR family transcriptional regulator [Streptomyces sp. WAC08401]